MCIFAYYIALIILNALNSNCTFLKKISYLFKQSSLSILRLINFDAYIPY